MKLAALSLLVTALYLLVVSEDIELAQSTGPLYVLLIVGIWWAGQRPNHHERNRDA